MLEVESKLNHVANHLLASVIRGFNHMFPRGFVYVDPENSLRASTDPDRVVNAIFMAGFSVLPSNLSGDL